MLHEYYGRHFMKWDYLPNKIAISVRRKNNSRRNKSLRNGA